MNTKLLAVCGMVALLLVGTGGAVASGPGFGPGYGADAGSSSSAPPASSPGNGAGATDAAATDTDQFTVVAENTEKCGRTCRDVTSTLTNEQNTTAEDVTVATEIYAGERTNGSPVWEGSEDVGSLGAGESHTATERIELSFGHAVSIKQRGGWITIQTTIETADQTVTLTEQRQVA